MNKRLVSIEALMPIITEQLLNGKKPIIPIKGTSMRPFYTSNQTHVELTTPDDVRKKDAVLYLNTNNKYILHRVEKIKDAGYRIRGDGLTKKEFVPRENIVARVTRHQHNKQWTDERSFSFRLKITLWQRLILIRRPLLKLHRLLRRDAA